MNKKELHAEIIRIESQLETCVNVPEYVRLIDELQELYREYKRPKTA